LCINAPKETRLHPLSISQSNKFNCNTEVSQSKTLQVIEHKPMKHKMQHPCGPNVKRNKYGSHRAHQKQKYQSWITAKMKGATQIVPIIFQNSFTPQNFPCSCPTRNYSIHLCSIAWRMSNWKKLNQAIHTITSNSPSKIQYHMQNHNPNKFSLIFYSIQNLINLREKI